MDLVNLNQLLNKLEKNLEKAKKPEKRQEIEDFIQKLETLRKIDEKEMLTKEDVRKAMSVTCYQNIGYCCGLAKAYLWRDSCRQALGIDDETYVEVKEAIIWETLERLQTQREG